MKYKKELIVIIYKKNKNLDNTPNFCYNIYKEIKGGQLLCQI